MNKLEISTVNDYQTKFTFSVEAAPKQVVDGFKFNVNGEGVVYNLKGLLDLIYIQSIYKLNHSVKLDNLPMFIKDLVYLYDETPDEAVNYIVVFDYDPSSFDAWNEELHKQVAMRVKNFLLTPDVGFKFDDCRVIINRNWVKTTEYPEDKYYLEENEGNNGKQRVPVADVLNRNTKALEANGFASINSYTDMEFSNPMVYKDKYGEALLNLIKKHLENW